MDNNDNQQKNPWSTFSDIDGREIFELLDTQQVRAIASAQSSGLPPSANPPSISTGPYAPVAHNSKATNSSGDLPYPAQRTSANQYSNNPYGSYRSGIPPLETPMMKSVLPPPPPTTDRAYYTSSQPPTPTQHPQSNSAYVQQDGLPHVQTLSPTPRFDLETMVVETGVPAMTIPSLM